MRTPPPLLGGGGGLVVANTRQYRRLFFSSHYRSSGGVVRAQVTYNGEQVTFTPEEVTAMVLVQLKAISENYLRTKVKDVVISIPGFFTSAQRRGTSSATNPPPCACPRRTTPDHVHGGGGGDPRWVERASHGCCLTLSPPKWVVPLHCAALLDSTQIAGLNCLKLVNEITATAIAYGIYKTDLPESDPMHVMFVDIGDSHMSVGVVAFQKGKLRVRPRHAHALL